VHERELYPAENVPAAQFWQDTSVALYCPGLQAEVGLGVGLDVGYGVGYGVGCDVGNAVGIALQDEAPVLPLDHLPVGQLTHELPPRNQ
jgi:hypothetical protein